MDKPVEEKQTDDYINALDTAAQSYNPPAPIEENKKKKIISSDLQNFDEDYLYTREKLKEMYEEGVNAIDHYREVAEETGEPRAVEVLANLIKSTASIAEAVMVNAKNKSSINKEMGVISKLDREDTNGNTYNQTNNNTIFVGTTNDLLKMLNEEQEKIDNENDVIDVEIENDK